MTAVFKDSKGVKRNFLWQYDKGQTLILENLDYEVSPEVHFATSSSKEALIATGDFKNGTLKVDVPDPLLEEANKITVYLYVVNGILTGETVKTLDIFVRPRKQPNDYIFSDGKYIVDVHSVDSAINNYISSKVDIGDIVIDYTTVHLTDTVTDITYDVGVLGGKLSLTPEGSETSIKNADTIYY